MKKLVKISSLGLSVLGICIMTSCVHTSINVETILEDTKAQLLETDMLATELVGENMEAVPMDMSGVEKVDKITVKHNEMTDAENGKTYVKAGYDIFLIPDDFANAHSELTKVLNDFNANSEESAKNFIENSKEEVRTLIKERNEAELEFSSDSSVSICRNDDKFFTFSNAVSSYTGGAHGNGSTFGMNYDINTGKVLTKDDIFADMEKLRVALLDKLKNGEQYKDNLFPDYEETINDMFKENQVLNILINEKDVDILFDPYFIGPWASGIINVTFDIEKDKDLFVKGLFN